MSAVAVPQQQFAQQQQGREVIAAPTASGSKGLPVCLQQLVKRLVHQCCPTCDSSCWLSWIWESADVSSNENGCLWNSNICQWLCWL
jgi:hypothetical protein